MGERESRMGPKFWWDQIQTMELSFIELGKKIEAGMIEHERIN